MAGPVSAIVSMFVDDYVFILEVFESLKSFFYFSTDLSTDQGVPILFQFFLPSILFLDLMQRKMWTNPD